MRRPRSPTIDLLAVFGLVFLARTLLGIVGPDAGWFALALPLLDRPWTVVTSVYAHAGVGHLLANAAALAVVGFGLERFTTRARFHAFVLVAGTLSGLAQVLVGGLLGRPAAVLGASGAILALYGYVLAGNRLTGGVLDRVALGRRAKFVLVGGLALLVTLLTAGAGVALVAHAVGFVLGLVGGRLGVLRVPEADAGRAGNASLK